MIVFSMLMVLGCGKNPLLTVLSPTTTGGGGGGTTITIPKVEAATILPNGGSFTNSVIVTIYCNTPGATIQYTTDGTDPAKAPSRACKVIDYGGPLSLTNSATLKVKAFKSGYNPSDVAAASFVINNIPITKVFYGTVPQAGISIVLTESGSPVASLTSDGSGNFSAPIPDRIGDYSVNIGASSTWTSQAFSVSSQAGKDLKVDFNQKALVVPVQSFTYTPSYPEGTRDYALSWPTTAGLNYDIYRISPSPTGDWEYYASCSAVPNPFTLAWHGPTTYSAWKVKAYTSASSMTSSDSSSEVSYTISLYKEGWSDIVETIF